MAQVYATCRQATEATRDEELNVKNLVKAIYYLGDRMEALTAEMKTKNELDKERLEFTRAKDEILAKLSRELKRGKKGGVKDGK